MAANRKHGKPKSLPSRIRRGQQGINLIEKIVLEMGSSWTPTGALDVGIDGTIELFDPASEIALGKILGVQSKVVANPKNETDDGFDYYCEDRDLDYWLQGNLPVVLIISQPDRGTAYWVSVKDYFNSGERRRARKCHFSKRDDRFDANCLSALLRIGAGSSTGLYLAPAPKRERLISNLLELEEFPQTIWVGATEYHRPYPVWKLLESSCGSARAPGDWFLHENSIVSFQNLSEAPWTNICDGGTCEPFNATEWAFSADPDRRRQFVKLLNVCLEEQLRGDIRYSQHEECFLFCGNLQSAPILRGYRSARRSSKMTVVALYKWTSKRTQQKFQCLRHLAFRRQFRLFDDRWYLEITPTYVFTSDGMLLDRYNEDLLKGIKRIEGNRAVLSPLLFWADYLGSRDDLLRSQDARRLKFGQLVEVELPVGIVDKAWAAAESESKSPADGEGMQHMFEAPDFL